MDMKNYTIHIHTHTHKEQMEMKMNEKKKKINSIGIKGEKALDNHFMDLINFCNLFLEECYSIE